MAAIQAVVFSFLAALVFCAPAHALDVGQCGPLPEITSSLKAEGQHSFASAKRLTGENEGITTERTLLGILITANDASTLGYILQTDKPLGEGATQACVYSRLANLRFYDARKPGIPRAALSKASAADAQKGCDTLIRNGEAHTDTCGYLNELFGKSAAVGERVIVQAANMRRQKDGSYQSDEITLTVTANLVSQGDKMHEKVGSIMNTTPDGATIMRTILLGVEYTPGGEERLKAASSGPQ
ncbi:MAG TPA: hypothetical protein VE907_04420 [Gammaproteobacteria bacterium]|nr:hypothetical protein [Gammaproteobacteria bacterium]